MRSSGISARGIGLALLLLSIVFCTLSQFLLKKAMLDIGSLPPLGDIDWWAFVLEHQGPLLVIAVGLAIYACGTVLWILCLTRLDLSFAYPVSTLQYLLVFFAAWFLLGETIYVARWIGMAVIVAGVIVMSTEQESHA